MKIFRFNYRTLSFFSQSNVMSMIFFLFVCTEMCICCDILTISVVMDIRRRQLNDDRVLYIKFFLFFYSGEGNQTMKIVI